MALVSAAFLLTEYMAVMCDRAQTKTEKAIGKERGGCALSR